MPTALDVGSFDRRYLFLSRINCLITPGRWRQCGWKPRSESPRLVATQSSCGPRFRSILRGRVAHSKRRRFGFSEVDGAFGVTLRSTDRTKHRPCISRRQERIGQIENSVTRIWLSHSYRKQNHVSATSRCGDCDDVVSCSASCSGRATRRG